MKENRHSRTRLLVGDAGLERLSKAVVAVTGLGGVGGHVVEALARAGVGTLVMVDYDVVSESNLNRQILATQATLGRRKTEAAAERVAAIDPACRTLTEHLRLTPENVNTLFGFGLTHVVDAIDDVPAKVALLKAMHARGLPHVSCMGAGGLSEPTGICVDDISRTRGCPLARAVRLQLRKDGVSKGIRCVFTPKPRVVSAPQPDGERTPPGTLSFMPGLIGLTAAGVIINDILACKGSGRLVE